MIPAGEDYLHTAFPGVGEFHQSAVEKTFGGSRRAGVIAADKHGVGLLAGNRFGELSQHFAVIVESVVAVEGGAEMPVGGVDNFH